MIEEETKLFLVHIVQTILTLLVWLLLNIYIGIYKSFGLFETSPTFVNVIYYIIFLGGSIGVYFFIKRLWKKTNACDV